MSRGRSRSVHRSHRRRWTGDTQARQRAAVIVSKRVPVLDGCVPGFECAWHGECSTCGDTIHLGPLEDANGRELPEPIAAYYRELIVGSPPRCSDCRGQT